MLEHSNPSRSPPLQHAKNGVAVGVGSGVTVSVSTGVAVSVGVSTAVAVSSGVAVSVGVSVGVSVTVGVGVAPSDSFANTIQFMAPQFVVPPLFNDSTMHPPCTAGADAFKKQHELSPGAIVQSVLVSVYPSSLQSSVAASAAVEYRSVTSTVSLGRSTENSTHPSAVPMLNGMIGFTFAVSLTVPST